MLFGHGDGGGGPTARDARDACAARATSRASRARASATPRRSSSTGWRRRLGDRPRSSGELYFEYHRGTYTSQAATKRGNRAGEVLLHDAEAAAAIADRLGRGLPGRGAARALADAAADAVPRHPARAARSARSTRTRERDHARVDRGGGPAARRGARGARATASRRRQHSAFARREVVATPDGGLRVVARRARGRGRGRADDAVTRRGATAARGSSTAHLRATLAADGTAGEPRPPASGREALAGPGERLRALRRPPGGLRRVGARPLAPRDAAAHCPPRRRRARRRPRRRCGPRSSSSARSATRSRAARRPSGSTRGARRLEVHCDGRLARARTRC